MLAPARPSPAPAASPVSHWPAVLLGTLIFFAVFIVYHPALHGDFLWDDAGHVTRPDLRSLAGLGRIWSEIGATQQYYPMLHSAFWFEHRLWGDAVVGYHLVNVLLHVTAACLFALVLRRLAIPGAWMAALLFALHPVCVESVAWISEQKNTLSLVFYLAATLVYLRFDAGRSWRSYAAATAFFILALLTKTVTATLPAALLVVFWWRRGRLNAGRDILPLLPWLALGALSGLATAHFERVLIGAEGAAFDLSLLQRLLLAGRVVWFYLGKLAWPAELIFIYPHWTIDPAQFTAWLYPLAALALPGVLIWRKQRGALAAVLLFGGALFPVLGFFNVFPFLFSYVADHFQYLASLPIHALAAAGLTQASARLPRWIGQLLAGALLAFLGALSFAQADTYRDAATLYRTTLQRNPECWMAHNNLAILLANQGRMAEAIPHLEQALALHPDFPEAENNLGDDLVRLERVPEAIPHFERAIQLQPRYGVAHRSLGMALAMSDRLGDALAHFSQAVALLPHDAESELYWGMALFQTGRPGEAAPHFERSLALNADAAETHQAYAAVLRQLGRPAEAREHELTAQRLGAGR